MSYHEIEDAIESLAYIIHQSSLPEALKKSRLQEIFSFQTLFDTSNTLERIKQILDIYGLHEKNIYLKKLHVLPLFADILELVILENTKLSREIYSIFLNAFLSEEIGVEHGIPKEANTLTKDRDFLRIRNILESYPQLCKKDARSDESDEYDVFPDISFEMDFEKDPEKRAVLRLLAEPKKDISQILLTLEKELSKKSLSDPWKSVCSYFQDGLGESYTQSQIQAFKNEIQICFIKKISHQDYSGMYVSCCVFLDAEEKCMNLILGLQFSEVLGWQKRFASATPELQHDLHEIQNFLIGEETSQNKHLHKFGGWKYDINQSEKVLLGHCADMLGLYLKYETEIISIILQRLKQFENFSFKEYQKEIKIYQSLDIVPKERYIPFNNMEGIIAYLILFHKKQGNNSLAQEYRDIFGKSIAPNVSQKRKQKHQAFVDYLDGNSDIFPEFFHTKNMFFDASQRTILLKNGVLI